MIDTSRGFDPILFNLLLPSFLSTSLQIRFVEEISKEQEIRKTQTECSVQGKHRSVTCVLKEWEYIEYSFR